VSGAPDLRAELLQEDAAARERALAPHSFIVEAPAGAGKTELLTQRYLELLTRVDHPEEVIALTFTNKAATEMRDRILGSLAQVAAHDFEGAPPHKRRTFEIGARVLARDAARQWQLLAHPGRLRITTIDALCGSLARQLPFLSRFGAQPAVTDEAAVYYQEAARRSIELLEAGGAQGATVAAALDYLDNDAGKLERLLVSMLARRDQWLVHTYRQREPDLRGEAEAGLQALLLIDLARAAAALPPLQTSLMAPARFAAAHLDSLQALADWQQPLRGEIAELPRWRALADLLLTKDGKSFRKKLTKNEGFPAEAEAKPFKDALVAVLAELPEALRQALARVRQLPSPCYDEAEWALVEVFANLLRIANAQLWLAFREGGEVDFIAVSQQAIAALGSEDEPTDLALALDYRIRHLLVDEFQDTSPAQVELLAGLTRGWQPDDGRTLFLVGDPMQSIYRFRKADVGLFLKVRERGIGTIVLESLRLYRNNRSQPAIVDWVNRCFPTLFPAASDPLRGAVCYAESVTDREADADAAVHVVPLVAALDDDEEVLARREAEQILTIVEARRRVRPQESIAVLARARGHLTALVAEIRRSRPGLAFQAVEIEALSGRQAIADLLSLCCALLHRGDRVHWLAILRAPWCGLTLADLHALLAGRTAATVWQLLQDDAVHATLSEDGRVRADHLRAVIGEAFAQRGRQHPRRWIEAVWRMLGGPATVAAGEEGDVPVFFSLIDELVAAGRFDAATLQTGAERLFAPPDPNPQALTLQMMTVHKSKGLEFDTVILPGLHRAVGGSDTALLRWECVPADGVREQLVVAPLRARSGDAQESSLFAYLGLLEQERAAHEDERVLYVAVTRARRYLHLLGTAWCEVGKNAAGDGGTARDAGTAGKGAPGTAPANTAGKVAAVGKSGDCGLPDEQVRAAQPVDDQVGALPALLAGADVALKPPGGGRPLALLWPWLAADFARAAASPAEPSTPLMAGLFVPRLNRLRRGALPIWREALIETMGAGGSLAARTTFEVSPEAALGTLVHRYLERIGRDGIGQWPALRIVGVAGAAGNWLRAQGLAAVEAEAGARRLVTALQRVCASEHGRWILAAHAEARCELALSSCLPASVGGAQVGVGADSRASKSEMGTAERGEVSLHVIDRTFIAEGCRWVIDYKTLQADVSDPAQLRERAETHRPQLARYAALFADDGLPVRMAIYFVLQDELLELVPTSDA
jgi:ATP-dependent helicase/nuclease subunit A